MSSLPEDTPNAIKTNNGQPINVPLTDSASAFRLADSGFTSDLVSTDGSIRHDGIAKVDSLQLGTLQVGPGQIGFRQVSPFQDGYEYKSYF